MNKKPLLALMTVAGALTTDACIQTHRFNAPQSSSQLPADIFKQPIHIRSEPLMLETPLLGGTKLIPVGKSETNPRVEYEDLIRDFEADPARHTSSTARSDYGAALLFAGRYADAIKVLIQVEKDYPGQYATASNLGTAYELIGDLENAAVYIRQGMKRNPESHAGTEWLHLAILETKQKLKGDPRWLTSHTVLDGQTTRSAADLEKALEYQLNERLYFIRNNDPVMCDLMYQAALITKDPTKRAYYMKQAPRFGTIRASQLRKLSQG